MTDAANWTEADLLQLIADGTQENISLDYKESPALGKLDHRKKEISKDVSAFANSAGGVIVYGMKEDKHIPIGLDGGYDPNDITKEWLEQVINSNVQRRISGIRIKQVNLETTNPGKVAYVVVIPQSTMAPHQANDKKFYRRFNFESVAMEEYEVRDVSQRSVAPDLSINISVETQEGILLISPTVINSSVTPAEYAIMSFFFENGYEVISAGGMLGNGTVTVKFLDDDIACSGYSKNHSIPGSMPIFDGVVFRFLQDDIKIKSPPVGNSLVIGWSARAPRMTPRQGFCLVKVAKAKVEVVNLPWA